MKFTRLKLHGFKSFCDQTELHLEPGLSGVVGPNGCGKSNLVEAMRWVMGESSYKAMRASGMDDVIFSGSGNRPGRNSAEVTLVLDNSDRTAPANLNSADVLEITRRIERESGSVYRVNGKEVRARDVQLLFADASTGAHSPALVRQGQIGELIAAKPTQRRALLEEAAGISGLHSRRHEAELRLRAAEQNLERVDDVIAQVETQLEALKRQARLAVRYRSLSGDIRRAEATLFHIRWVAARFAEKEAEAEQGRLVGQLAEATHLELEAQKIVFLAEKALQPLRDDEAARGAALQRLTILAEQLAEDIRRTEARRRELADRLRQAEADAARESVLLGESDEALKALAEEKARLEAEAEGEVAAIAAAQKTSARAGAAVAEADAEARRASEALAQLRALKAQARRMADDAAQRARRIEDQLAATERDSAVLSQRLEADESIAEKRAALEAAQALAAAEEGATLAAEEATREAEAGLEALRPQLQGAEAALNRLESEAATLQRMVQMSATGRSAPIVDMLKVEPGFETALGAALGDDLEAATEPSAPLRWTEAPPDPADPPLPPGVTPLADYVSGTHLLARRLAQIGLVERSRGAELMGRLKPGQRLVSREGDLWRWDGLVAAADAPTAAAVRLEQRNRLAELADEIDTARRTRAALRDDAKDATEALDAARRAERERRDGWRNAQRDIAGAQQTLEKAQKALGDLTARQSALAEAHTQLTRSLEEARASLATAEEGLAGSGSDDAAATEVSRREATLKDLRAEAEQARLRLGSFEAATRMRRNRLDQIARDAEGWQRRQDAAKRQADTLAARMAEIAAQQKALEETPEGFAGREAALALEIEAARRAHKDASDAFATAQARHKEADRAQRLAAERLSGVREQLGRIEERIKGFAGQRQQIERQVHETLGIPAQRTAEAAGIKAHEALPQEGPVEQKLERLKAERERLGGVNLNAERESEEVRETLETMTRDRDDLIAAIAKLRTGIQSLNREGRQRLSEAFEKVNGHFQTLFTSLFGGGTAELRFVESEDPLEAGLEIFARPPGKKPSTMTLLSGGEQALTAMSLIFAVFLTNPAPICVLDEVDAPLDDANVERFCNLLDSMRTRTETRFLVITHNPITMSRLDRLFGVTMAERGVSQLVSVDLKGAESFLEAV
ncbi:chromosome segregation protein SMC [Arsenicitalea aurantiaca]|uniref:Chromosome partition protein Smc n=1 Tax=Arsenicitalea aurantiaca TaxID=1783274 RepID=A0A433XAN9_9HYPH|nr:AAA family ATPase [Arsenicitalea aurantiaca]RUT31157.1 chromosome segregation protein SMC [Arsenicitalea aurantiaca]